MVMEYFIKAYWFLIASAITFIVWLVRLESKVIRLDAKSRRHDSDIEEVQKDNKEEIRDINRKLDNMTTELTKICISFSELSGYIKGRECNDNK
jgi:seryl-tRNA synthetase